LKETLAEFLRTLREEKGFPLRKVAAALDVDQSSLSKFERGDRLPKEDLIPKIAQFFGINEAELHLRYKSDKVLYEIMTDQNPEEILKVAEEKLQYLKSKQYTQGKLFN